MDSESLKAILSAQDQSYRSALELFLGQVNAKVDNMQKTVMDLKQSLEFSQSEIVDLKREIIDLKKANKSHEETRQSLHADLVASSREISNLEERCNYQEDYNRRNNLQIAGLEETQGETWEQTVNKVFKLLEEKLELQNIQLERAHRVGQGVNNKPRPIIARFSRYSDREATKRAAIKLRGTKIFFNDDLCKASQEIRKAKLPSLKRARSEGKIAYFSHTKLIIREKSTNPANLNEKCHPNSGGATGSSGGGVGHGVSVTTVGVPDVSATNSQSRPRSTRNRK